MKPDAPQTKGFRRLPPVSEFARKKRHPDFGTFDPDDLELFHQGYPDLVLLDDNHSHNEDVDRWVEAAAGAVDALYTVVWPTEVAMAYVHTYPTEPRDDGELNPEFSAKLKAFHQVESKLPTLDCARTLLRAFIPGDDVYSSWKAPPAFYILEHFLGPEAVASAILERFGEFDDDEWAEEDDYDHARILLEVLGFLLLRMPDDARGRVVSAIAELVRGRPASDRLTRHLRYLPDQPIALSMDEYSSLEGPWFMGDLSVSSEQRWHRLERRGASAVSVRALYLDGLARMNDADLSVLLDGISRASMLTQIDTFGRIKHPSTVRRVLSFGRFQSMLKEVLAWKQAHAEYVDEVLPMFAKDACVQLGVQGLSGTGKPIEKAADPMAATEKLLEAVEKQLPDALDSQVKVTALIQAAADEAREIARLDGQDYPEVYFTALWPEFPFSLELTDAQYELLSNAYETVILRG